MTEAAGLLVRLEATTALLRSEMKRAEQQVGATASKIERDAARADNAVERMGNGLKAAMSGFAAGFAAVSLGGIVTGIVQANVEFQKLQASLVTVTGSAENAKTAFNMIEKFAAETPFDLAQVTGGFVKMTALGLKPSEDAMRSYGNTASAMGKSFNDFIEAIADATMGGGFERLKEFGIVMQADGDKVKATFQGVTETIGKNAGEIEGYLRKIGNTAFAGAMAREMDTLGGKFANLGDQIGKLQRQIGEGGLNSALIDLVSSLTAVGGKTESTASIIGGIMGAAVRGVQQAVANTRAELEHIAQIYERMRAHAAVGPAEGVTVPVVDNTPIGKLTRGANFLSGNIPKQPIDPNATPADGVFITKETGVTRNGLEFGRPTYDDADKAAGKAGDSAAKARDDAAKKTQDVVAALEFEADQLGRTAVQQEIYNKLKEAGTTADTMQGMQIIALVGSIEQEKTARDELKDALDAENKLRDEGRQIVESVRTPTETYTAAVEKLRTMYQAGAIDATTFNRAVGEAATVLKTAQDETKKLSPFMQEVADLGVQSFDRIGGAITESFVRGENAFENLRSVGLSVVNELMNAFIKLALINPLLNAVAGTAAPTFQGWMSGGGLTGNNFSLGTPAGYTPTYAPARAIGGPTVPGASYLVGERGPEIFEPTAPGRIVPRVPSVGGRAAGVPVQAGPTVVQHLNFALGVTSTVRAEIQNLMPKIAASSRAAIMDSQSRRGRSL